MKEARDLGYEPDAVIALSNGGSAFGDQLAMDLYSCPFVTLWNNRYAKKEEYMDSPVNMGLLRGLRDQLADKPATEMRILLVDDLVGRAKTANQARDFIKQYLGTEHVRFLPLFYQDEQNLKRIVKFIVWKHPRLANNYDDTLINEIHQETKWQRFPYGKRMHQS